MPSHAAPIAATTHPTCGCAPTAPKRSGGGRALSLLSAAALVLMPKCPFCLVGWMGALGLGGLATHATAIPVVLLVVFCATQAVFLRTARRTGDLRAVVCAGLGVAVVAGGYVLDAPPAVRWLGVALLVGASISNAVAMARARRAANSPAG